MPDGQRPKFTSAQGGYGVDHPGHGEEGRRTLQVNRKDLGLPVQALADEVAKILGVRCVHHVEVVSSHDSELHVLLSTQNFPAVRAEVSAVVKQPLHGGWVLLLSRWGPGVVGVSGYALSAPDSKSRDGLQGRLRLVCR